MSTLKTHNLQSPDAGSVNIAMAPNSGMVVAGLSTYSNQINVGNNIKLGNAGVITATTFVGAFTGTASGNPTMSSGANDRVMTATGSNAMKGESALTFDGATLDIDGGTTDTPLILDTSNASGSHLRFRKDGSNKHFVGSGGGFGLGNVDDLSLRTVNNIIFGVGTSEKVRIDTNGRLSFAGDTDTYIHHPQANQLAITIAGGSFPTVRFGTGGSGSTVGFSTDTTLVTNAERISVRGFSSFKSYSNVYAAIYTHNEGNTSGTYNPHILWNAGGANRGGIGYMPNNGEVIFNNQNPINFATGATNLGGTTRLRIDNNGYVTTPSQPSFRITKTGGPFNTGGGTVVWNNVIHNTGSHYNTSNGRFTAPVAGTYIFHYYSIYQYNSSDDLWDFKLNGSTFAGSRMHYTHGGVSSNWDNITNTQIIELNANDYVEVYASDQTLHGGDWTHFCGHLLG